MAFRPFRHRAWAYFALTGSLTVFAFATRAGVKYSYDAAGNLTAVIDDSIPPPVAAFAPPANPMRGSALVFTDQSTTKQGQVTEWAWDFGDGSTSTDRNPVHVYVVAGTYAVTLEVTNDLGASASTSQPLVVAENYPPIADFTFSPATPAKHELVTFADTSIDDDGIVERYWSIGSVQASVATVDVTMCNDLLVTLTVFDHLGQSGTASQYISVGDGPPVEISVAPGELLAGGVSRSCPGDTIALPVGTFEGGVTLFDVNLVGAGAGSTFVVGHGYDPYAISSGYVIGSVTSPGNAAVIAGVTIRGGGVSGVGGGGVSIDGQGLTRLVNVEVSDNVGDGGVRVQPSGASAEVRASTIHHNTNDGHAWYGAGLGMYCCGDVTITDTEISYNSALYTDGGGAAPYEANKITFARNYVHHNSAGRRGGGLFVNSFGSGDQVFNNRFSSNTAAYGSGGGFTSGSGTVLFAGNLVTSNAGGGVLDMAYSSSLTIVNSTIADNAGAGLERSWTGATQGPTTVVASIIAANTTDVADLLSLSSRANFLSPPTLPYIGGGDYRLAPGSAAVDAGDNSAVPLGMEFDLEGAPRIIDGDGDGFSVVDVGYAEAPEHQVVSFEGVEVTFSAGAGTGVVTSTPGGLHCDSGVSTGCSAQVPSGAIVELTANPSTDSQFVGWSGDCQGTQPTCQLTLGGPAHVGAVFEPSRNAVTARAEPS